MTRFLTLFFAFLVLPSLSVAYSEREGLDIYQRGHYQKAIKYWIKAAASGDAGSAYRLSEEYFDAKVVKRDLKLALKYLHQAADKGDPRALTDLASLYDNGIGVKENRKRAAKLYLRAAKLGIPAAMFNIASMLETGEGITQNEIEAYKFYLLSKDLGFAPFANKALAVMASNMTPEQLAEAEKRANNFVPGVN